MTALARDPKNDVAAIGSLLCPGLGQVIKGEFAKGFAFFLGSFACLPILWPWSVIDAYNFTRPALPAPVAAPGVLAPLPVEEAPVSTGAYKILGLTVFLLSLAFAGWSFAGAWPWLSAWIPWWLATFPMAFGGTMVFQAFQTDVRGHRERERHKAARLEREVLLLAQKKGGRVTSVDVATQCGATLDESRALLERLAKQGHVGVSVSDDGVFVYKVLEMGGGTVTPTLPEPEQRDAKPERESERPSS